jgi:alkylhydroperoxidase family enzyme
MQHKEPSVPNVRITPVDPPYPAEIQAEFDKIMRGAPPLLLFRTVARNPRVLQRFLAGNLLEERSVFRLADQLHATSGVGDQVWQEASSNFAPEQLIELVMLAGLYHAVSFMVNAFGVQHEESAPKFPRAADKASIS